MEHVNETGLTKIFKLGIWLAGSTATSQSEAMLEKSLLTNMGFTY